MNNTSAANGARRLQLSGHEAKSLMVAPGTRIQTISGTVWLTQEGDSRDHCVPAGVSFCTDRKGQLVLTAIGAPAQVRVYPSESDCVPGTVKIDSMQSLTRAARAQQAQYVAYSAARLAAWVTSLVRRARAA